MLPLCLWFAVGNYCTVPNICPQIPLTNISRPKTMGVVSLFELFFCFVQSPVGTKNVLSSSQSLEFTVGEVLIHNHFSLVLSMYSRDFIVQC